ncbi:pectate lyase [Cellulomonas sp. NPDC055163]
MDLTNDTRSHPRPVDPGPRRPRRRALAVTLALAVGALGAVVGAQSATAAPPTIDTQSWYELESWRSRLVLAVDGASTADGAAVVQEASTGAASQRVRFLDSGSGYLRVAFAHSGKVLTIGSSASSLATQSTDSGATSQQFSVAAGSSGRIKLVNRASGLALQVVDSSKSAGARWNQATDTNATNQQLTLRKVSGGTPDPTSSPSPTVTSSPSPTVTSSPTPTVTSSPTPTQPSGSWPSATSTQKVSSTIQVSGTLDGRLVRYYGISSGDQGESQPPMFQLSDGAVLKNVIIGTGAGDGVHCTGTCTLQNVWWEDVGEDAATLKGSSTSQVMTVTGGGAKGASDKVFQHNGPGTFVITGGFQVTDFGKLYRSCGNCSKQYARTVKVDGVQVTTPGKALVGINSNLGDKATLRNVTIVGDSSRKISICDEYKGVTSGEPSKVRSGPSAACGYSTSDITYR